MACFIRHLCRCSCGSELPVSRFKLDGQSFRTFHLFQVTGILPGLSATFGVSRCVSYLYCSCVFWATLFGVWLCLQLISFLCFLGEVWCVVVSVVYIVFVFPTLRRLVCGCICYLYRSCVFGEENGSAYYGSCCGYEGRLLKKQTLPRFPYRRRMLPKDGAPNRIFLT